MRRAVLFLLATLLSPSVHAQESLSTDDEYSRSELFSIARNAVPGVDWFALPSTFAFPDDARATSTFGIDHSHHNDDNCGCTFDWDKVAKQKVQFVIHKATQGVSYTDPTLAKNAAAILALKQIDSGAYHFLTASGDTGAQAANYLAATRDFTFALPPTLDLEWDPGAMRDDCPTDAIIVIRRANGSVLRKCDKWGFVSSKDIIDKANAWIDAVATATGRTPILYTNANWFNQRIGAGNIAKIHTTLIWTADYSRNGLATEAPKVAGGIDWTLWQFTDGAKLNVGNQSVLIDANIFEGSIDELRGALDEAN